MKLEQLQLALDIPLQQSPPIVHDPYWDEITQNDTLDAIDTFNGVDSHLKSEIAPQHLVHCVGAQIPLLEPPYKNVGAQVTTDTRKIAPQQDIPTHWVEKYWVERNSKKYWYYRYCWMEGRKKHRVYIGSVNSTRASQKKEAVELAIREGESPLDIKQLITRWNSNG